MAVFQEAFRRLTSKPATAPGLMSLSIFALTSTLMAAVSEQFPRLLASGGRWWRRSRVFTTRARWTLFQASLNSLTRVARNRAHCADRSGVLHSFWATASA